MGNRIQRTGSFIAVDRDGNRYRINVFTNFVEVPTRGGIRSSPRMQRLETEDGYHVNHDGKGKYSGRLHHKSLPE